MTFKIIALATVAALSAANAFAAPATLTTSVFKETVTRGADGAVITTKAPADKITPGDRVIYVLTYHNGAAKPASNVVISNPIPADLQFAGAAEGATSSVSSDGKTFVPADQVKTADVTAVRWVLAEAVPAGGEVRMNFRATVK